MNWFLNTILIIFAALFQTTIMHFLSIKLGIANIILVIFIILIFFRFFKLGLVWAVFGGLILDFLSATPVGLFLFGFLLIYLILVLFLKPIELQEFFALLLMVFLASIFFDLFSFVYFYFFSFKLPFKGFYNIIIFNSLLNIILGVIIYPILVYIRNYLKKGQRIVSLIEMYK